MIKGYWRSTLLSLFSLAPLQAGVLVDCRVALSDMTECNPYGEKLIQAKVVRDSTGRRQLTRLKRKPIALLITTPLLPLQKSSKSDTPTLPNSQKQTYRHQNLRELLPKKHTRPAAHYGKYSVLSGDTLSHIAKKFDVPLPLLMELNGLSAQNTLEIGKVLLLPMKQSMVNALATGKWRIRKGDTLYGLGEKFHIDPMVLAAYNHLKKSTILSIGQELKLPLSKRQIPPKEEGEQRQNQQLDLVHGFGKRKLRVTATAYTSHGNQTDSTPFLTAWNNILRPGMKSIAVSRDLLKRYGMKNGTRVRIGGLPGLYRVRDKMNKRYKKRIDIYMGLDLKKALRWGKQSVVIYW